MIDISNLSSRMILKICSLCNILFEFLLDFYNLHVLNSIIFIFIYEKKRNTLLTKYLFQKKNKTCI